MCFRYVCCKLKSSENWNKNPDKNYEVRYGNYVLQNNWWLSNTIVFTNPNPPLNLNRSKLLHTKFGRLKIIYLLFLFLYICCRMEHVLGQFLPTLSGLNITNNNAKIGRNILLFSLKTIRIYQWNCTDIAMLLGRYTHFLCNQFPETVFAFL
jgi:hypothetical protein